MSNWSLLNQSRKICRAETNNGIVVIKPGERKAVIGLSNPSECREKCTIWKEGRRFFEYEDPDKEEELEDTNPEEPQVFEAEVEEVEEIEEEPVEAETLDLDSQSYRDLQNLAKENDIKANQSKDDLIAELSEVV